MNIAKRVRDSQRSKLYAAERTSLRKFDAEAIVSVEDVRAYYRKVTRTKFFRSLWKEASGEKIEAPLEADLADGRGTRFARAAWTGYERVNPPCCGECGQTTGRGSIAPSARINVPKWARRESVLLHELGHVVIGPIQRRVAPHGREFARVYLKLVRRFMGEDAYVALRDEFRRVRVRWHPKRAKRALTEAQRAVLRKRAVIARAARAVRALPDAPPEVKRATDRLIG